MNNLSLGTEGGGQRKFLASGATRLRWLLFCIHHSIGKPVFQSMLLPAPGVSCSVQLIRDVLTLPQQEFHDAPRMFAYIQSTRPRGFSSSTLICLEFNSCSPVVDFCCSDSEAMACLSFSHCFALFSMSSAAKNMAFVSRIQQCCQHQTFGLLSLFLQALQHCLPQHSDPSSSGTLCLT